MKLHHETYSWLLVPWRKNGKPVLRWSLIERVWY